MDTIALRSRVGAVVFAFSAATGLAVPVFAASAASRVTVRISPVERFRLDGRAVIYLDPQAGASQSDATARLGFVHNADADIKVTGECTSCQAADRGVILKVSVAGGSGTTPLFDANGPTGSRDVYTGIAAGVLDDKAVVYTAQALAAALKPHAGVGFTVTYTSLEQ